MSSSDHRPRDAVGYDGGGDAGVRRSSNEMAHSQPPHNDNGTRSGQSPSTGSPQAARDSRAAPAAAHRNTSTYDDRLRKKLQAADKSRSRAVGGGGAGPTPSVAASIGGAATTTGSVVGPSSSLVAPPPPEAARRISSCPRDARFWDSETFEEEEDDEKEGGSRRTECEERRAATGLRSDGDVRYAATGTACDSGRAFPDDGDDAPEVRAETGLRPGDVESFAAAAAGGAAPAAAAAANAASLRRSDTSDEKATMSTSRRQIIPPMHPPRRASTNETLSESIPGAHYYGSSDFQDSFGDGGGDGASSSDAGGGGGGFGSGEGEATGLDTEAPAVLGGMLDVDDDRDQSHNYGHGHDAQHLIVMDQNDNPMVVAQAVEAVTSERDLRYADGNNGDSFDEEGLRRSDAATHGGGRAQRQREQAPSAVAGGGSAASMTASVPPSDANRYSDQGEQDGGHWLPERPGRRSTRRRRSSGMLIAMAVATKDTFTSHLLRSRRAQCGLLALVLAIVGLTVGLVVALKGGGGGTAPPAAAAEEEGFWQEEPPTVDGSFGEGEFGASVSLNGDGTRLAVGSPGVWDDGDADGYFRRGLVEVYRLVVNDDDDDRDNVFGSNGNVGGAVRGKGNDDPSSPRWELLGTPIRPTARDSNGDILDPSRMGVRSLIKVVLSEEGDTVAVGSSFHDVVGNGTTSRGMIGNAGMVEVFQWRDGTWTPLGDPVVGERPNDYLGASLDLSVDGGTLAVGVPGRAKTDIHGGGAMAGGDLVVDNAGGTGANAGDVVVENAGAARMFLINNGRWEPLGSSGGAAGSVPNEMMGGSISLSADGRTVAVGSSATREGMNNVAARVFRFEGGDWSEAGSGVEGREETYDTAYSVVLSADGNRLVVSNHYIGKDGGPAVQSEQANSDLFVAGFDYDEAEDDWTVIGNNLHEYSMGDKSGYFIALSADGKVIGMGDPGRSVAGGGRIAGHAHIYVHDDSANGDTGSDEDGRGGKFVQVGPNIDGEAAGDMFGYEVALSGDGRRFAVGAPSSRGNGYEHGRVQVYDVPQ